MAAARTGLIDVVLDNSGSDHGHRSDDEAGVDTLERAEVDAVSAESRIDDFVHDGDEGD